MDACEIANFLATELFMHQVIFDSFLKLVFKSKKTFVA